MPAETDDTATRLERARVTAERSAELFELAPLGICISTATGEIVACNPAFARLFGFPSVEAASAVNMGSLYADAAARERFLAELRRHRRLGHYRETLRRVDGGLVYVIFSAVGHFDPDGALTEIRGYLLDDTPNVEAEQSAREREHLFRAVFFDTSDAILLVDDRRAIVDANPAASSIFERETDGLIGETLDQLMPEPADTWSGLWRELLGLGEAKREHPVKKAGGTCVVECLYQARVRPGCHLCVARDITDRRLLDDRLAQVARIESVGRLAGGIAHDFNNLLTAVLGFTELLLSTHPPGDPERADLEEIQKAGRRASLLTQQLLAFGRRQMLEPQELDLNLTIGGSHALLRHMLREDIDLVIGVADVPAVVMVDPGQMEQAVVNLVLNSRDALTSGGTITIQVSLATLSCGELPYEQRAAPGRYVLLRVTDDGAGISAEARAHLFEPFFTTKGRGKGAGLGLAFVHGLVRQSGGFVDVESPAGGGTVVTLHFPAVGVAGAHVDQRELPGRETILLVDDEDPVRAVIGAVLRRNGYTVLEASTAQGAYEVFLLHAGEIGLLLLTDVATTAAGTGSALALRCVAEKSALRVLFISDGSPSASPELAGPNIRFLEKPFPAPALTTAVRTLLDRAP
jgi:PAS domain S-box-containing protein